MRCFSSCFGVMAWARTCVALGAVLARGAGRAGRASRACGACGAWLLGHLHQVVHIGIQAGNLIVEFLVS